MAFCFLFCWFLLFDSGKFVLLFMKNIKNWHVFSCKVAFPSWKIFVIFICALAANIRRLTSSLSRCVTLPTPAIYHMLNESTSFLLQELINQAFRHFSTLTVSNLFSLWIVGGYLYVQCCNPTTSIGWCALCTLQGHWREGYEWHWQNLFCEALYMSHNILAVFQWMAL